MLDIRPTAQVCIAVEGRHCAAIARRMSPYTSIANSRSLCRGRTLFQYTATGAAGLQIVALLAWHTVLQRPRPAGIFSSLEIQSS